MLAAFVGGAMLAGCGGSDDATTGPSVGEDLIVEDGVETVAPVSLPNVWSANLRSEDGTPYLATLAAGASPVRVSDASGAFPVGSACAVDPARDAAVPIRLTMRNDDPQFTSELSVDWAFATADLEVLDGQEGIHVNLYEMGLETAESVLTEISYGSGVECTDLASTAYNETPRLSVAATLDPGQSTEADGWVILAGFYGPAHPGGDANFLAHIWLALRPQGYDVVGDVTGPGVVIGESSRNAGLAFFPLDGISEPSCLVAPNTIKAACGFASTLEQ